ncbi:integrase arm-type DNA-binding domain-containing protein [Acinetobacter baumannii]|uniref:tyrosine-type recombinase/integrase n=1 Tax=Acinetobacter baumannii TaxID=470 RepID=UPI0028706729|nr:integrase arm-type DNA-binding domain-containing protein [Acinetobacter baumannii]MDR9527942.1 integrase arm-type DNA-binding domain-containing protein [Acinetobacter baumannii]
MAKIVKPLTDTKCAAAKPKVNSQGKSVVNKLADGNGLYLIVRPTGTKTWQFIYGRKQYLNTKGRPTDGVITIGDYSKAGVKGVIVSLDEAREKRRFFLSQIENGIDPIDALKLEEEKLNDRFDFESITRQWHVAYAQSSGCQESTIAKSLRNFEMYVFPLIGERLVDSIKPRDLSKVLEHIEKIGFSEVYDKIKRRLGAIFAYAVSKGYIHESPALHLKGALTRKKEERHYPKLPLERLPEFFQRLKNDTGNPLTKLYTEFALHTFTRSSEMMFARWSEFDLEKSIWTIPPTRTPVEGCKNSHRGAKMRREHIVPLSRQVKELLQEIKMYSSMSAHVFPAENDASKFISENTVNKTLTRMKYDTKTDVCLHGFRGMARGALALSGLFDRDAIERQMSHKSDNEVEWAYTHHVEYLEERKIMMQWWSDYLDQNKSKFISPQDFRDQLLMGAKNGVHSFKYGKLIKFQMAMLNAS